MAKLTGKAKQRARKLKKSTVNTILKNMEKTTINLPKMLDKGLKIDYLQTANKTKFYNETELMPSRFPLIFTFPEGMEATDKPFIANAMVYPPNSNMPIWTGNTNKLACYMNCLATGADRDKNERFIQIETPGVEGKTWMLQISVVGIKHEGYITSEHKELQSIIATVIKSLPEDFGKHFIGNLLINPQITKMTHLTVANKISLLRKVA
jgi:hypothetical protein